MSENENVSLSDYIQMRLEQDMKRLGIQGEDPTERLINLMKALEEEGSTEGSSHKEKKRP